MNRMLTSRIIRHVRPYRGIRRFAINLNETTNQSISDQQYHKEQRPTRKKLTKELEGAFGTRRSFGSYYFRIVGAPLIILLMLCPVVAYWKMSDTFQTDILDRYKDDNSDKIFEAWLVDENGKPPEGMNSFLGKAMVKTADNS